MTTMRIRTDGDYAWRKDLVDEHGAPSALIESTDEAIRSWAVSTIDAYRREAEPLDPDVFTS